MGRDRDKSPVRDRGDYDRRRSHKYEKRSRSRSRSRSRNRRRSRSRERQTEHRSSSQGDRHLASGTMERHHASQRDHAQHNTSRDETQLQRDAIQTVGSIHQASVHSVKHFGLFLSIPSFRRHVLVYHTQVADDIKFEKSDDNETRSKALDFLFPPGHKVWVKITTVEPDERSAEMRVNGSMRAVSQSDGIDRDPHGRLTAASGPQSDEPPEEGSVHRATVKRIEPYGVFVQMDGFRRHGLVHSSQVSSYLSFSREDTDEEKKAELGSVVAIGDIVFVKVVEVVAEDPGSGRGPKIGCSIKLVDQTSGEDLDPNGLRFKPRGEAGPSGRADTLGASAGNVVAGKMDWGHLAGDNRLYVGDHAGEYSLLEEDARGKALNQGAVQQFPPPPPIPLGGVPGQVGGLMGMPRTVEEALAIIEQYKSRNVKNKRKSKKKEKEKKGKKERKDKKAKKQKKQKVSSSSGSSDSGSK